MIDGPLIDRLNRVHRVGDSVRFEMGSGGLARCVLSGPGGEAHVYLHGAHVSHYQPANGRPVLFGSGASLYADGEPIRGGVPVCFPWFGPHAEDADKPAHGFARTRAWTFRSARVDGDGTVVVTLALSDDEQTREMWPHSFIATAAVELRREALEIGLTVVNMELGSDASKWGFEAALHSYFVVGDVRGVQVEGLSGVSYIDKVDGMKRKTQGASPVVFEGETDRVYVDTTSTCRLVDPRLSRVIEVSKSGSRSTVVWNPWIEKAARMPDFGDEEWPGMVCIETANAGENAVVLGPGDTHRMSTTFHVLPLE